MKQYVDEKVLNEMINLFAPQIPFAAPQLLSQLYDTAKASPQTSTKATLRMTEGLALIGTLAGALPSRCEMDCIHLSGVQLQKHWCVHECTPVVIEPESLPIGVCLNVPQLSLNWSHCKTVHSCRALLLTGFEEKRRPVMCKFTVEPQDVVREAKVLEDLWREPALTGVVGPVKLVKVNSSRKVWGQVDPPDGQSTVHKYTHGYHQSLQVTICCGCF